MYILSISAFYHDSAAVLIKDGVVISAIEEERLTRIKHDNSFPFKAIDYCLKSNKLKIEEINKLIYYEKPLLKFERIIDNFIKTYPKSIIQFVKIIPEWLDNKLKVERIIRKDLNYEGKIFYLPHHLSHASASYYGSGFSEAAILTIDGVGEYQTTVLWKGKGKRIVPLKELNFPNSLGLLYSTFTAFIGFRVNEGEYKMMGLAAYGKPRYVSLIKKIIDIKDDGSFRLNYKYFGFRYGTKMWTKKFEKLFGTPRNKDEKFRKRHKDIAASIQQVTEEIYISILNKLYKLTECESLCISGGVALNALANGKIYNKTKFKNVYILGASGDSGAALGAGLWYYNNFIHKSKGEKIGNLCLGSSYTSEEILSLLKNTQGIEFVECSNEELIQKTAKYLVKNKIIGWFQDKCEFGPRALGNRSILASPIEATMKEKVNLIKRRELFRPFAGSVVQTKVNELFEVPTKNYFSPFMNFCFKVKDASLIKIASIVHKDKTCRIQTISIRENRKYYNLINAFYKLTGIPCILNTSFNLKNEPLVESPEQAVIDFMRTNMDYLAIGKYLCKKIKT